MAKDKDTENLPALLEGKCLDTLAKDIPINKIIEYKSKGLSLRDIGKLLGCTHQNIAFRLQAITEEMEGLEAFKTHKADTLAVIQSRLLNSLTDDELKKTHPYQRVGMFGILHDKEKNERGIAQAIIGYTDLDRELQDYDKDIEALEAELGLDGTYEVK